MDSPETQDELPKVGEICQVNYQNPETGVNLARMVLVQEVHETPFPWVSAVLIEAVGNEKWEIDPDYIGPSDIFLDKIETELPYSIIVETDIVGPVNAKLLSPAVAVLPKVFMNWVHYMIKNGEPPFDAFPRFGKPWVADDARTESKTESIEHMQTLASATIMALLEGEE